MGNYTQLTVTDRRRLYHFIDMGISIKDIAVKLGRHRSTIYRELNRNSEEGSYLPIIAHQKAQSRSFNGRISKIQRNGVLRDYVIRSLAKGWSPEQISGRMKVNKLSFYICHESIYRFIYHSKEKKLYYYLTYKKPVRRRRFGRKHRLCRYGESLLITHRPKEIEKRDRFGHWEGDTIQFRGNKSQVITTLVERKSRMVFLIKNDSKHSIGVMERISNKLKVLPEKMCKTITFDQGCEFAAHETLKRKLKCKVFYCQTHSPWQKGSNENMNGRLRRYLPKGAKIDSITQDNLDLIADKMNRCPRKCIGYKTPKELYIQQVKNDSRIWS